MQLAKKSSSGDKKRVSDPVCDEVVWYDKADLKPIRRTVSTDYWVLTADYCVADDDRNCQVNDLTRG